MIKPEWIRKYPRLFLNHDTYERHWWTARLLGDTKPGRTVADIGGERNLELFAPQLAITNINISGPDVIAEGISSVPDNSFDYAVSLDTLEHIPPGQREDHLKQLLRLARRRVVFCAPIGQAEQVKFQKAMLKSEGLDEASRNFVREHLEYGMPTPQEVEKMLPGVKIKWLYSGNIRRYLVPEKPPPYRPVRAFYLLVGLLINYLMNLFWLPFKVDEKRREVTNRFYGVIDLEQEKGA